MSDEKRDDEDELEESDPRRLSEEVTIAPGDVQSVADVLAKKQKGEDDGS